MHKDGKQYLKNSIKQKYCYPFRISKDNSKCLYNHPKYNNGHKNRACVKYKSIGTEYRASADYFKFFYSMRTESKRYNSRFKNLNLESLSIRNIKSIENLNTLKSYMPLSSYTCCNHQK